MGVSRAEGSRGTSTTSAMTQQEPKAAGTTDKLVGRGKQLWGQCWKVVEGMAESASKWRRKTPLFHGGRRVADGDGALNRQEKGAVLPEQDSQRPGQDSQRRLFRKFYWSYVPFLALLGTIIMFAGLVLFSIAAVQSGQTAREIVDLVQGGASGFSWIVGAYKTTVTVTVAVTVFTIAVCMCVYGVRADQRLRQDLKYGQGERQRKAYTISQGVATALLVLIFVLATWFVLLVALNVSATVAMVTLSQGAAAAMVILNTAVAVAQNSVQAAENALGLQSYSLGNYTTLFGNSTAGLVADSLAAGQQLLDIAGAQNGTLGQAARGAREVLVSSMGPQSRMTSPSSESSGLTPALSSTLTAAAQQMMNAARVTNSTMTRLEQSLAPTTQGLLSAALNGSLSQQIQELGRGSSSSSPSSSAAGPQALDQTDSLSSLRQSLTSLSSAFDNFWTGPPNPPQQPRPEPRPEPGRQPGQLAALSQPQPAGAGNQPQPQPQPQPDPARSAEPNPGGAGAALGAGGGRRLRQQEPPPREPPGDGPPRPVPAAGYSNSTIGGLLNALMPTQENLLQLAGAATHVVAELQRVAGAPEDQTGPIGFGTGTSVCPSLVCLDVKLYSFLNSAACICNAQQLQQVHDLGEVARDRFRNAVIGVVLLYFGTSILLARLAAEVAMIARDKHLLFSSKFDSYHERQKARLAALATSGDPATLPSANPVFRENGGETPRASLGTHADPPGGSAKGSEPLSGQEVPPATTNVAEPKPATKGAQPVSASGKASRETELCMV